MKSSKMYSGKRIAEDLVSRDLCFASFGEYLLRGMMVLGVCKQLQVVNAINHGKNTGFCTHTVNSLLFDFLTWKT